MAAVLVALALVLRVGEVQRTPYRPIHDAVSYLRLGAQVASTGDYAVHGGAGGTRGPTAYFPPGYPYLLAAVDLIGGHRGLTPAAVHDARLAQAMLGTILAGLVGLVAMELLGPLAGLLALGLAAVYPVFIELSGVLVAETLLVVCEMAAVYLALRARRSERPLPWIGGAGVMTGLTALTHENGILIVLPLLVCAFGLTRRRWAAPLLLIATTLLTLSPWLIRDAVVMHRFVPISDESGITLVGTYNSSSAAASPPYRWQYFGALKGFRQLQRTAHRVTETQLGNRLQARAFHYIHMHPLAPLHVLADNTRRLAELEGAHAWELSAASIGLSRGTAQIGVWSFWALGLLALGGLYTRAVRRIPAWTWGVPVLLWLSVALVNAETPRFREALDPFLILLAAGALAAGLQRVRRLIERFASPG